MPGAYDGIVKQGVGWCRYVYIPPLSFFFFFGGGGGRVRGQGKVTMTVSKAT